MTGFFVLALALVAEPEAQPVGCEPDAPIRDPAVCKPIYDDGDFVIYTMESVAVGTIEEMRAVRARAQECGLTNRIDHVGPLDLGVFDIINANKESRACIKSWIQSVSPDLEFSEERLTQLFQTTPFPVEEQP